MKRKPNRPSGFELTFSFLFPMLVGKAMIVVFGGYYSQYPGQGYGYGLVAAIALTLLLAARFIWRYWDYQD